MVGYFLKHKKFVLEVGKRPWTNLRDDCRMIIVGLWPYTLQMPGY